VKLNAEPVNDAMEEDVEEIFARVEGGMMSTRAATRSRSDSEVWSSWSDATDISESGVVAVSVYRGCDLIEGVGREMEAGLDWGSSLHHNRLGPRVGVASLREHGIIAPVSV
jgi:hypothetical protein